MDLAGSRPPADNPAREGLLRVAAPVGPICTDGVLLTSGIWLFSWWALWRLIWAGQCGPYVAALAVATHVRLPPPLGQVPPVPDPVVLFFWAWSLPVAGLSLAIGCWSFCYRSECSECWWWWAAIAAASAATALRRSGAAGRMHAAFEDLGIPRDALPEPPQQPLVTYLYAYCYYFFRHLGAHRPEHKVRIETCSDPACPSTFDVWLQDGPPPAAGSLPVLLYIHGGGWRGGHARAHPQAPLLQALAARGWFVVSAEYRKSRWPQQLDDSLAALRWVCGEEAAAKGADRTKLFLSGTSAGGHVASLLTLRSLGDQLGQAAIRGLVLFYPALDPGDVTGATATFPFGLPCLRVWRGRSMLAWFFELFVLGGDASLWPSAQPLEQLLEDPAAARAWPPTLIVHGDKDSVVPVAHSQHLLSILAAAQDLQAGSCRPRDALVVVPGGRHTFELAPSYASWATLSGAAAWLERVRGA